MSRHLSPEQAAAELAGLCLQPAQDNRWRYRVVFIAGAGLSEPAVPLSRDLARVCAAHCSSEHAAMPEHDFTPAQQMAFWLERAYPEPAARRAFLRSCFEGKTITPAWLKLARLMASGRVCNIVISTCFDDFASRALELFQLPRSVCDTILSIPRFQPENESVAQVFQAHGGVFEYDCARLLPHGRDDYRGTISAKISAALSGRIPVVLGYSGLEQDAVMLAFKERAATLKNGFYWYCHSRAAYDELPVWLKEIEKAVFIVPPAPEQVVKRLSRLLGAEASFVTRGLFGNSLDAFYALECLERALGLETPLLAGDPAAFFLQRFEGQVQAAVSEGADVYFLRESVEKLRRDLGVRPQHDQHEKLLDLLRSAHYEEALGAISADFLSASRERRKELAGMVFKCLERLGFSAAAQLKACDLYADCRGPGTPDRARVLVLLRQSAVLLSEKRCKDAIAAASSAESVASELAEAGDLQAAALLFSAESLRRAADPSGAAAELKRLGGKFFGALAVPVREGAALALVDSARLLAESGAPREAAAVCLDLWGRAAADSSPEVRSCAHEAARLAGELLAGLGQGAQSLSVFDASLSAIAVEKGREFTDTLMPEAILSRAQALLLLGRLEEALSAYESSYEVFSCSRLPSMEGKAARALLGRASALSRLERQEEAVRVYGDVALKYGASRSREALDAAGKALLNKGARLAALGRHKEAVAAYDALVRRFRHLDGAHWAGRLSRALLNKALSLKNLQDNTAALAACDEAAGLALSGSAGDEGEGARAVYTKGVLLAEFNRVVEAGDVFGELAACYGSSQSRLAREFAARGLVEAGLAFKKAGKMKNAAELFERAVEQFGDSKDPAIRSAVERAATETLR